MTRTTTSATRTRKLASKWSKAKQWVSQEVKIGGLRIVSPLANRQFASCAQPASQDEADGKAKDTSALDLGKLRDIIRMAITSEHFT